MSLRVTAIFQVCEKTKKKNTKKKLKSLLTHILATLLNFLWFWCVVSLGRQAPPQQLWCSSDVRLWSYECVKIASLLFLLIYSCSLRAPCFLGLHDTLLCVLIAGPCVLIAGFSQVLKSSFSQFAALKFERSQFATICNLAIKVVPCKHIQ